ncbi:RNA 2',3'-cyclic phosphodiesterase [Tumebacillus sp. DT12]|uniref:RNA 2',3'-cyclic phosphodiesterase n=1 Tax=Tumebacillus lacus TaxID=2995335 RepID=A0ABT3WYY3_9BACL|nr:RNA 2',3'-cyclic phosphodiesterase [Tumebacillus lacus]MCX7569865.1 RNA 2',3'-cyclic phosphodiesterase [Tumebacillus lacus]
MGRYFLGVEVPAERCGAELTALQERLAPLVDGKRWYRPEQLHLTTHFFGELNADAVEEMTGLVAAALREQAPFELRLGKPGWFPQAKVVWCGVAGETEAFQSLYRTLTAGMAGAERLDATRYAHNSFKPHITLGRLKSADGTFRPESAAAPEPISWTVEAVHLFESVSAGAAGPSYPIRHTFAFGKK